MILLAVALGLRVGAAGVVTWYAARVGKPCVFGDTAIYVALARTIAEGTTYQVSQWGVPHYALRTPGYPLFLAACRAVFGPSLLAVRLVQAVLGVVAVWGVARLTRAVGGGGADGRPAERALGLAAVEPYVVALAALVLVRGGVRAADGAGSLGLGHALAGRDRGSAELGRSSWPG